METTAKNFIFDLGNVLVDFNADRIVRNFFEEKDVPQILEFYFPQLWNQYDQGLISKEELIEKGIGMFPKLSPTIRDFMNHWPEEVPVYQKNYEMVKKLKDKGYGIYILSNIPEDDFIHLKDKGLFDIADGYVVSWQEKLNKPDPRIFQKILNRYSLTPENCLFIDDRKDNIKSAQEQGIHSIKLEHPEDLQTVLAPWLE